MTTNQNQNARNSVSALRARRAGLRAPEAGGMIRMDLTKDKRHGPHTEQEVRDALDDHGLVVAHDNAFAAAIHLMEVVG